MDSKNTILALAYIRETKNPLSVFCNMITYCLHLSPKKILRNDELIKSVGENFGLRFQQHLINTCIRLLKTGKQINILSNGAGYQLVDINLDIKQFEKDRKELNAKEEKLLFNLIGYVGNFKKSWSLDDARNYLTKFLVDNENAYNIFVYGKVESREENKNYISPNWYVKMFIEEIIKSKNSDYEYLIEVVRGLMIYVGLNQTSDYTQEKNQKFRGTCFYLDTKLLLRILGYSWTAAVEATQELVNFIVKDYEGRICVFEHTIGEVKAALAAAEDGLRKNIGVENPELRAFKILKNYNAEDFKIAGDAVRNTVENILKYEIAQNPKWNDNDVRKYNLDWDKLFIYIKTEHPTWNVHAIMNDISSINYINILRKGDYRQKYGGKDKLPVFVTTNYPLIKDIRNYITKCIREVDCSSNWSKQYLPVISDNSLMFRLWLPKSSNYSNLPILTLARTVYTVQQQDNEFYERVKATAKDVSQKHQYDVVDLPEYRNEKLYKVLAEKSGGNFEKIDDEMVASSFEELLQLETAADKDTIKQLSNEKDALLKDKELLSDEKNALVKEKDIKLVDAYSQKYLDKLGLNWLFIFIAKYWWIVSAILIVGLTLGADYLVNKYIKHTWLTMILVVIPFLLKVIDKLFCQKFFVNTLENRLINKAKVNYICKIKEKLTSDEYDYENAILDYCIQNSKIFNKDKLDLPFSIGNKSGINSNM